MPSPYPASVHGGHSGEFCSHAKDTLEEIILAYIDQGYPWVGITEHMPPVADAFVYPEEREAGMDAAALRHRFADYIATGRRLQSEYAQQIQIYVGFETEDYSGSRQSALDLIRIFSPDYVVGSVHHVHDICFDAGLEAYTRAARRCGGLDGLYADYFDQQYDMIRTLKPHVVGHLDIIRIHDPDYRRRLVKPAIWDRIVRNL
ncbi:MAG TPA: histidinol-phosphatase HisJ family protein, partial [Desulfosarcina sp.]|nr:histidinol-phosphatase HisJ family protein [Desulfosarcina sp.]